jgi:hypothetical protein
MLSFSMAASRLPRALTFSRRDLPKAQWIVVYLASSTVLTKVLLVVEHIEENNVSDGCD